MADDLLKSLFLRARDQYESAIRWTTIVVIILFVLHLMVFSRYVTMKSQLALVGAEATRYTDEEKFVGELATDLQQVTTTLEEPLDTQAADTLFGKILCDMIGDFQALNMALSQARTDAGESSVNDYMILQSLGGQCVQTGGMQAQSAQMPNAPYLQEDEQEVRLGSELQEAVQQAKTDRELQEVLQPYIEKEIITPRFNDANRAWQEEIVPVVRREANALLQKITDGKQPFPEQDALWAAIQQGVEKSIQIAESVTFEAPTDDPNWWSTVAGKEATLANIAAALKGELDSAGGSHSLAALKAEVHKALANSQELQTKIQTDVTTLTDNFNKQQSKLTALGEPFAFVAVDLDFLVAYFPLLLGLALAATLILPAYRLPELAWAVERASQLEKGQLFWEWFSVRTGLPYTSVLDPRPANDPSRPVEHVNLGWDLRTLPSAYHQNPYLVLVGRGLLYAGWVALASWQLMGLPGVPSRQVFWLAAGGFLAIAMAVGYQWYVTRRVLGQSTLLRST